MKGLIETFSDKSLIITFFLSFVIVAIGFFKQTFLFEWGQRFLLVSGLFLVLRHSGFIYEHRHVRAVYLCISIMLMGMLFRIERWPYSSYFFLVSYLIIPWVYALRFISKKTKGVLDWLKLVWVILYCVSTLFYLESWPYNQLLVTISTVAFFMMMAFFFHEKKEVLLKSFN